MRPRDALHRLVDDLSEGELPAAARLLEELRTRPQSRSSDHESLAGRQSNGLARFAGTWSAEEFEEFQAAVAATEQVDEELWG